LKAKYSPDFAAAYKRLPPELQRKFQEVDRRVQADDFSVFERQGWAYFIDLDADHIALANHRKEENVFYWVLIYSRELKPIIY
jgi:hypothetical protein